MVKFIDCEQGTEQWLRERAGIPTASQFSTVLSKGQGNTRRTYLLKLAGERLTGEPMESYSNAHMERGKVMEAEAREAYAFMHDADPQLVGFARRGDAGASPDALVGDSGLLEIKTLLPHLQLDVLDRDRVPPENVAQLQGQLWICEREWVDYVSYWPGLPLFVKRVHRDEEYIKTLADEVQRFNDELAAIVERFSQAA